MATIEIELYKGKKVGLNQAYYPIRIRVYKDGVPKVKTIGSAKPEEWNDELKRIKLRSRKDYAVVNDHIEEEFNKYKKIFKRLEEGARNWKPEEVFEDTKFQSPYFQKNALEYIETLRGHSKEGAEARLRKIMRFAKEKDFPIEDISEKWIAGYKTHCKTQEKNKKGETGNGPNTIMSGLKFVKRICSYAGIVPDPVKAIKISTTKTIKNKLNKFELLKFAEVETLPGSVLRNCKNIYLLSFYFRGMRISDALQLEWTDFKGLRLLYDASKTGKEYDMTISSEAKDILDQYPKDTRYVFPFFKWEYNKDFSPALNDKLKTNHIKACTALINRYLKMIAKKAGIEKNISTHINRHSYASIADKELKGDIKTIQQLLNHGSRAMTEGYINDLRQTDELDTAADQILGSLRQAKKDKDKEQGQGD